VRSFSPPARMRLGSGVVPIEWTQNPGSPSPRVTFEGIGHPIASVVVCNGRTPAQERCEVGERVPPSPMHEAAWAPQILDDTPYTAFSISHRGPPRSVRSLRTSAAARRECARVFLAGSAVPHPFPCVCSSAKKQRKEQIVKGRSRRNHGLDGKKIPAYRQRSFETRRESIRLLGDIDGRPCRHLDHAPPPALLADSMKVHKNSGLTSA
jgi:hypothetical protein